MTQEQDQARPLRPGLDSLTGAILGAHEFARDTGGELFLLPGNGLREQPYIPRSFLTRDVMNLAHDWWRQYAIRWNAYRAEHPDAGQPVAITPSDTLIRNAVRHLEALGSEHGRRMTAELRAVRTAGGIVIDLGDSTGEVAYVSADGWKVTDPRNLDGAPPVFRRSTGYGPLPRPVSDGDLGELWKILRMDGDSDEAAHARNLATGWLTAAYFADVSRPGLWFTGPPGAGKTTAATGVARLIDGTDWLDGKLADGKRADPRDNIIRAAKSYVVSFDNMSAVTAELSDWICYLVTGHRDTFRRMRTNFDDVSMAYKRTFVATGLSLPYGLASDALDRVIEVPLSPIASNKRVSDDVIQRELDEAMPGLLGALLDHVARVLAVLPRFSADGAGIARMNGYAQILLAHDVAYHHGQAAPCAIAYQEASKAARADKAASEPVIAALARMLPPGTPAEPATPAKPSAWQGKATELWNALAGHRTFSTSEAAWWPADGRALSDKLTALDNELRASGFTVVRKKIHGYPVIRIERWGS